MLTLHQQMMQKFKIMIIELTSKHSFYTNASDGARLRSEYQTVCSYIRFCFI